MSEQKEQLSRAAGLMGRTGGKSTSPRKSESSRRNAGIATAARVTRFRESGKPSPTEWGRRLGISRQAANAIIRRLEQREREIANRDSQVVDNKPNIVLDNIIE